jgi:biopolymer transport protein ExbB/TolQ
MRPTPRKLLIAGLFLIFGGPFAGLLLTVIGMAVAFHSLGQEGVANPQVLSGHIGTALIATMVGFIAAMIGAVMIVTALVLHFATGKPVGSEASR